MVPESDWKGAGIHKLPPGVLELLKGYQDAVLKRDGPGHKPNLKEAVVWLAAVALCDGDALGKLAEMEVTEDWVEKQRKKRQAKYQARKRAAVAV